MRKRFLIGMTVMLLAIVGSCMPNWLGVKDFTVVNAQESEEKVYGENGFYTYYQEREDGTIEILGRIIPRQMLSEVVLPDTIDGKKVTKIAGGAFNGIKNIETMVIADGIEIIGQGAFKSCEIKNIRLPDTLKEIGVEAFYGSSITELEIPEGVKVIPDELCKQCNNLTRVVLSDTIVSIGERAFQFCPNLSDVVLSDKSTITSIGESAFDGCTSLKGIALPDTITSIGSSAFFNCQKLTEIKLPEGITVVPDKLCEDCTSLNNVVLPDTILSIGKASFLDCQSLKSITFPKNLKTIGKGAFASDYNFTSDIYSEGFLKTIYFKGDAPEMVGYSESVFTNGCTVFYPENNATWTAEKLKEYKDNGWVNITWHTWNPETGEITGICGENVSWSYSDASQTLTIRGNGDMEDYESLTDLPWYDIRKENKIKKIIVENGVTRIGKNVFHSLIAGHQAEPYPADSLERISIGNSVREIGDYAFFMCNSIENIDIPDSVKSIGEAAFSGCEKLQEISIPDTVADIGAYAFRTTGIQSITVPDSVNSLGFNAFCDCVELSDVNLGKGITVIPSGLFNGCVNLKKLTIPDNVTSIEVADQKDGSYTTPFSKSLEYVTLSKNMTEITEGLFYECTGLKEIVIPSGIKKIGDNAFNNCTNLTKVKFLGDTPEFVINNVYSNTESQTFRNVTATVYYPENEASWKSGVMCDYGGTLTWSAYSDHEQPTTTEKPTTDTNQVASGQVNNITWTLDSAGNLLIVGSGDWKIYNNIPLVPWEPQKENIKSAKVQLTETTSMKMMFEGCSNLVSVDFTGTDTSKVTDMSRMFSQCENLVNVDFTGIDTSKVTDMSSMFRQCKSLVNVDLHNFDTSSLLKMEDMFAFCSSLESVDFSSFNTSNMKKPYSNQVDLVDEEKVGEDLNNDSLIELMNTLKIFHRDYNLTEVTAPAALYTNIALPLDSTGDYVWNDEDGNVCRTINEKQTRVITYRKVANTNPVKGMRLESKVLLVKLGETNRMKRTYIPANPTNISEETWTIESNEGKCITMTEDGTITGKKLGTAEVWARYDTPDNGDAVSYGGNGQRFTVVVCNPGLVTVKQGTYYMHDNGKMAKNEMITVNGKSYYFQDNCRMLVNDSVTINGKTYKCNEKGEMTAVSQTGETGHNTSKVTPKGTSLSKLTGKKKSFVVKWKKQTKNVTGYQIQYSTKKNFKNAKIVKVKSSKIISKTIKKLKAKTKYYVRIRTYYTGNADGKVTYSKWSKAKKVKTK